LPGIGPGAQVAGVDRAAHRLREGAAQLALTGEDALAHRARAIVVLGRRGEDGAAAGNVLPALEPGEPALEDGAQARQAGRLRHRRAEHRLLEARLRALERLHLQVLLRPEVREQPALRHAERGGEGADREAFQAALAGERQRLVEDRRARALALAQRHSGILPTIMSFHITQSPARLYQGCEKVAGRFFSKKKWPTQAKP